MNVPLVQCNTFDDDALANILLAGPAAGCLNGAFLMTFNAVAAVTKNSLLADIIATKSTFHGYADKVITWAAVGKSDAGVPEAFGTSTLMAATDSASPESIFILAIVDSTKAKLYFAAVLQTPIPMVELGDQALVTVRMNVDGSASLEVIS